MVLHKTWTEVFNGDIGVELQQFYGQNPEAYLTN